MSAWMTPEEAVQFLDGGPPLSHLERLVLFADLTSDDPMELVAGELRTTKESAWKALSSARRKIREQVEAECESDLICDLPGWAYSAGRILRELMELTPTEPSNPLAGVKEGSTRQVGDRLTGRRLTEYDYARIAAEGGCRLRRQNIPWEPLDEDLEYELVDAESGSR